jgi:hypothetical protein
MAVAREARVKEVFMENATLCVHKSGSRLASEGEVLAVPPVAFTDTWRPFAHAEVLRAVGKACSVRGLTVERKEYGLGSGGATMFATWQVAQAEAGRFIPALKEDGRTLAIGIRNSMNKALSVGLCAGERVFVCDNLAFSSDVVVFRRHTGALSVEELDVMADVAVDEVMVHYQGFIRWQEELGRKELRVNDMAFLIRAVIHLGIVPDGERKRMECWMGDPSYAPRHDGRAAYPATLAGFYGAATEVLGKRKRLSPLGYFERNGELNTFMEGVAPRILETKKGELIDLGKTWEAAKAEAAERVAKSNTRLSVKARVRERLGKR